jgi:hypothetical protein
MAEQEQVVDPNEPGSSSEGNPEKTGDSEGRVKELEGQLTDLKDQLKEAGPASYQGCSNMEE